MPTRLEGRFRSKSPGGVQIHGPFMELVALHHTICILVHKVRISTLLSANHFPLWISFDNQSSIENLVKSRY